MFSESDSAKLESRLVKRDSLFMLAAIRFDDCGDEEFRVCIRNISAGGLMVEGPGSVAMGQTLEIQLRNAGWVQGYIAWAQDGRFGITLYEEIDPKAVRATTLSATEPSVAVGRFAKPSVTLSETKRVRRV